MVEHNFRYEKAMWYTSQMVELAQEMWGDVHLHPETHTWDDGTVSVFVEHRRPNYQSLSRTVVLRLNFQETGFRHHDGPQIRETVTKDRGDEVLYEELISTDCIQLSPSV